MTTRETRPSRAAEFTLYSAVSDDQLVAVYSYRGSEAATKRQHPIFDCSVKCIFGGQLW